MTKSNEASKLIRLIAVCSFMIMATALAPSGASAEPRTDFTPELTVSSSTYRAGAHPDLTIEMHKTRAKCLEWDFSGWFPTCPDIYIEQNLKKVTTHFPPGLVTDANAAPYCDPVNLEEGSGMPKWVCRNTAARVGIVRVTAQACDEIIGNMMRYCFPAGFDGTPVYDDVLGVAYNARPRTEGPHAGEQGHIIVLWTQNPDVLNEASVKMDLSVVMRESGDGIDTVGDDMPDAVPMGDGAILGQIVDMVFTLEGSTELEKGHPLITNPTFCDPQTVDVEYVGYKDNSSITEPGNPFSSIPGSGDGNVVKDSAPYQATNCDELPYEPTFTTSASTYAPGAAPAISTVIAQKDGEATTKKTVVTLPKGMGVNLKNTLKPCPPDALAKWDCPESSLMATAEVESKLLPIGDTLKGNTYLTDKEGNKLGASLLLKGFVNLRIDGNANISKDGSIKLVFDNQPAMPTSSIKLNFLGGEKALLTNPKRCVPLTTKAEFTSHSGKTHTVETSMGKISGCKDPTFEVELSEKGRGKRTAVVLEVRSDQKPIKEVKFGLARHLKWTNKGLGKKRKRGVISVNSDAGTQEAALKLGQGVRQKKKKAINLTTNSSFSANLYRQRFDRKGVKVFKHRANKRDKRLKKKTMPKNMLSLKSLPNDDLSVVTVELNPDETKFIKTPKRCKRLYWLAIVKTEDGSKYYLRPEQPARLGCDKSKKKKKKKTSKKK